MKVMEDLVSPKASPLGWQMTPFLLCPHKGLFSDLVSLLYKDTSHMELGPHPYDLI